MKKHLSFKSPIVKGSFVGIYIGEMAIAGYTNTIPGAIIGGVLGMFFGPIGLTIGTALGMAVQTFIK